jgi:CRP-like cAMP-binding protein
MNPTSFVRPWASVEFTRKFATRLGITPDELPVLAEMFATARPVRRRQDIVIEGRRNRVFFIIVEGLLIRYRITRDGHRQVVNVAVPGDVAGVPSCFFDGALYSIRTLTNAVVASVSVDALPAILRAHPQLVFKLCWLFACDAALSAEHVVVVGRRAARERIAHFFLELLFRLQAIGLANESSYRMPFSQDVICDALGLSLAYVNRELRNLSDAGLVAIRDHMVTITDVEALSDLADFEARYLKPSPAAEVFPPPVGRSWGAVEALGRSRFA